MASSCSQQEGHPGGRDPTGRESACLLCPHFELLLLPRSPIVTHSLLLWGAEPQAAPRVSTRYTLVGRRWPLGTCRTERWWGSSRERPPQALCAWVGLTFCRGLSYCLWMCRWAQESQLGVRLASGVPLGAPRLPWVFLLSCDFLFCPPTPPDPSFPSSSWLWLPGKAGEK